MTMTLRELVNRAGLQSAHFVGEGSRGILDIDSILVVGSTCAGKSTLVRALREAPIFRRGAIDLPVRYVTREARIGDLAAETRHLSPLEFDAMAARGELAVRWTRPMEAGREERYGFGIPRAGSFPVFSANNAVVSSAASVVPAGALHRAMIVEVFAPVAVRRARLMERSPDLCAKRPEEAAHRLAEDSRVIRAAVHVVIENHGEHEEAAAGALVRLAGALCHGPVAIAR